jgi:anthranilate phosphoribosyltransferase
VDRRRVGGAKPLVLARGWLTLPAVMADSRKLCERLDALCRGEALGREDSRALFAAVMHGEVGEIELAGLLTALRCKGESPEEIAGAAEAMRAAAVPFDTGGVAVADSCGTGGDGQHTVNVSTAAALVAAAAGLPIAKHGNRGVSSRCGSADVLAAAGVRIDLAPEGSRRCLHEAGMCFLFAPQYHLGVRHAMPVRRALGMRTLFNLLGPLANPARPRWQLMGVFDAARCEPLAATLGMLGCERALVVHGGGLDEIALHAPTTAALFEDGAVRRLELTPEQAGVGRHPLAALAGGDADDNARWLEALCAGEGSVAHRDAVAINAGALLWVCGRAPDLGAGAEIARAVLARGEARRTLARLREVSQRAG